MTKPKNNKTVHLISLGCPKNRVDSEVMLGHLKNDGYKFVDSSQEADVIVVNTCSFVQSAKEESIDTILEVSQEKKQGRASKIVVAGCLSQRYAPELAKEIPEVDHFLGTGNFESIADILDKQTIPKKSLPIFQKKNKDILHPRLRGPNKLIPFSHFPKKNEKNSIHIPDPDFTITSDSPRVSTLPYYMRYLKISEGCSNTCSFCIIPKLRGPQRSRSIHDIIDEFESLLEQDVVEINLIAQDLCAYGKDLTPKKSLAKLLKHMEKSAKKSSKPVWIRCLYAYPRGMTKEVMRVIHESENIIPYLDMPLQHVSDRILRNMRRGKGGTSTKNLVRGLRQNIPNLTLRTTFITGLPGETQADFEELKEFTQEIRFEHMGVFPYSQEEDTPAATMKNQVKSTLSESRKEELMLLQKEISKENQKTFLNQTIDVLVEGVSKETDLLLQGRHKGQAPDIDGITYITSGHASPGETIKVCIEQTSDYDLAGRII